MPKFVQGGLHRRNRKHEKAVENMKENALERMSQDMPKGGITEKDSMKGSEEKRREKSKTKKTKQSEQTLDTSQLLQKKDDRRI